MENALSLTRGALTRTCKDRRKTLKVSHEGRKILAYTQFFSQSAHRPLTHILRAVDGTYICLLDPRLANDIDSESFRGSYVSDSIFVPRCRTQR